ncbi:MAG: sugar phosphate nucleotidyltransferase [Microgenomates group bacterium]
MKAIVFAGGVGTRLWPLSRKKSPKQFEKIIGDKSTLQLAVGRVQPDFTWNDIYVSTGKQYVEIVESQLTELPKGHVIGEPVMRDVGPAVGLVTALFATVSPDEPMVILWSDHLVKNEVLFRKILKAAGTVVSRDQDKIVFVSQKPRFASENLGWIDFGETVETEDGVAMHAFVDFQYRPDEATAKKYFESGHHAWNLGYFVTTPRFLLSQYKKFVPNVYEGLQEIAAAWHTDKYEIVLEKVYPTLEKISFDNAILEKLDPASALVVSENIEWSDIGAWEALKESLEGSSDKNVIQGKVFLKDVDDCLVYNYGKQLVVGIDVSELLIVNTDDVLMVCKKTSVPKIKKIVEGFTGTEHESLT